MAFEFAQMKIVLDVARWLQIGEEALPGAKNSPLDAFCTTMGCDKTSPWGVIGTIDVGEFKGDLKAIRIPLTEGEKVAIPVDRGLFGRLGHLCRKLAGFELPKAEKKYNRDLELAKASEQE